MGKLTGRLTGKLFGTLFGGVQSLITSLLPPTFPGASNLLTYWDGTNSDATHKTDLVNGYDLVAVEGPCLTLAIGDTVTMAGHGASVINTGTAVLSYDGTDVTVTTGGTLFELEFEDGTIVPCCEGVGAGSNATVRSTSGLNGTVTVAAGLATAWGSKQDLYFFAMTDGWYEDSEDPLIQWPAESAEGQQIAPDTEIAPDSQFDPAGIIL